MQLLQCKSLLFEAPCVHTATIATTLVRWEEVGKKGWQCQKAWIGWETTDQAMPGSVGHGRNERQVLGVLQAQALNCIGLPGNHGDFLYKGLLEVASTHGMPAASYSTEHEKTAPSLAHRGQKGKRCRPPACSPEPGDPRPATGTVCRHAHHFPNRVN